MTKENLKPDFVYLVLLIYTLLTKLFTCIYSPLFDRVFTDTDAAIFYNIGNALMNGKILYKDIFDHKTPYIYFFNAIASLLDINHMGLYIFEVLLLFISLIYTYKLLCTVFNFEYSDSLFYMPSFIGTLIMGAILTIQPITFGYSRTETYALSCLIPSVFLFCRFFYSDKKKFGLKEIFIIGVLAGVSFMTNIRAVVLFVPFVFVTFILLIKNKSYKNILLCFLVGIFAFILSIVPYLIYMFITDSFSDMIEAIFIVNFSYFDSTLDSSGSIIATILAFASEHIILIIFTIITLLVLAVARYNIYLMTSLVLSYITALFYIFYSNRIYIYYMVIILPYFISIYVLIISLLFKRHILVENKLLYSFPHRKSAYIILAIIILVINVSLNFGSLWTRYINQTNRAAKINGLIQKHFGENEKLKILALGLNPEVYIYTDAEVNYKYFFTPLVSYKKYGKAYDAQYNYLLRRDPDIVIYKESNADKGFPKDIFNQIFYVLHSSYEKLGVVRTNEIEGEYQVFAKPKS